MVRKSKANWWLVLALLPLMILLLFGDAILPESPFGHGVLEIGIVFVTFGLMALWVHANQDALIQDEYAGRRWILTSLSDEARSVDALPLADSLDDIEDGCEEIAASAVESK